jgi:EAL domain-containing protein (putative c-di-GMP-specific phosphodiesterase class I)
VGVAIDDFGTGYSSLSYLQRFPIDSLKIDRSFVAKMGERGESPEILRAILTLARSLDIEVIAEGVETEAQLGQLLAMGCGLVQGYLFSRPVDREAARALLDPPHPWAALLPARRPAPALQEHHNVTPLRRTAAS